ncbi:NADH dehydrogenase [ubiquinone] iron-sulfur protein 2, partial [Bienertia sinuspersici]
IAWPRSKRALVYVMQVNVYGKGVSKMSCSVFDPIYASMMAQEHAHSLAIERLLHSLTPFPYALEEPEKLLELYERIIGAQMHASFIRPTGVAQDLPLSLYRDIDSSTQQFASRDNELEDMSTGNRIWKQQLLDIAKVKWWGYPSQPGLCWDLQRATPYDVYNLLDFNVPVGIKGDRYDR